MTEFWTLVVGGAFAGGVYAILAAGVVLTYQTSGIFNFAHGAVAFATAFLFFQLDTGLGWNRGVAAVVAIGGFAPGLGWVLDRLLFRRLAQAPPAVRLVAPIALLVAIPSLCVYVVDRVDAWFGAGLPRQDQALTIPGLGPEPVRRWRVNGILVNSNQIAVFAAALVAAAALWLLVRRTRLGLRMRAVVDRRELSALRGIDPDRTSGLSWMIGSFLAGLAGVLLAPVFKLNPPTFTTVVLISTPAVVLARFRSLPVAFVSGLLIGVAQNLVAGYVHWARSISGFTTAVPFILLFAVLLALGHDRGGVAALGGGNGDGGPAGPVPASGTSVRRSAAVRGLWVAALLVYVFAVADDYWRGLLARGLALGLVLLSFTIVTGIGGMVSLAQAAFVTAGGLAAGWALSHGWPFLAALTAGTLVAAALGAVVALPARRLGGLPLALSTMAVAFIAQHLVFQLDAVSNGSARGWRITPPRLGPLDFRDEVTMVVGLLALLGLASFLVHNLARSASGRAAIALRASEPGAVTAGIRAGRTELAVFALSAGVAGFGGVLLAATKGSVSDVDHPVEMGLFWLSTTVVFGIRRPAGAVLAGLAVALTPDILGQLSSGTLLPQVLAGLGAVTLARDPDGILGIVARQARERRRRGAGPAAAGAPAAPAAPAAPQAATGAGPGPGAPVLRLSGVRAGYGDVEVLHGIDLEVAAGEVLALVGANGAGKSTVCAVAAGLLRPAAGGVHLAGRDVTAVPPFRRVAHGALLAPEGRGVFPSLTVEDNLRIWLPDPDDRAAACDRFAVLAERRRQAAGSLSGGEQQMLALAPALVRPPLVLVADEPSLGLAPLVVEQVYGALRELKEAGTAVLLVEEKANDVLALADTVAFLRLGRVAFVAPARDLDEDRLARAYLGMSAGG